MLNSKTMAKNVILGLYSLISRISPAVYYFLEYYRTAKKMGNFSQERHNIFNKLIAESMEKKCLQIGVKDDIGRKYAPHWVSVDRYDTRDFIDFNYDIHDLKFPDNEFDVVVCISVLEHVSHPEIAIKELYRVLRPGGKIWVQLPFCFPYHESPKDYWRVSPDGLRIWMKDFNEIFCGSYLWTSTALVTSTFFYGTKAEY